MFSICTGFVFLLTNTILVINSKNLYELEMKDCESENTISLTHILDRNFVPQCRNVVTGSGMLDDMYMVNAVMRHIHNLHIIPVIFAEHFIVDDVWAFTTDDDTRRLDCILWFENSTSNVIDNMMRTVSQLNMQYSSAVIFLVLLTEYIETNFFRVLQNSWEYHKILNCVLVYFQVDNIIHHYNPNISLADRQCSTYTATYNEFRNEYKTEKSSQGEIINMPSRKFLNVNGQIIKTDFATNVPMCILETDENGKPFYYGIEVLLIAEMITQINGTMYVESLHKNEDNDDAAVDISYLSKHVKSAEDVLNLVGKSDQKQYDIHGKLFAKTEFNSLTTTYTVLLDDMVILVPKSENIPIYMVFLLPFSKVAWFVSFLTVSFMFLLWKKVDKFYVLERRSFIHFFEIILVGSFSVRVSKFVQRLFMLICMTFNIIMNNSYSGALYSFLTVPQYYDDINTVKDWMDSGLQLAVHTSKHNDEKDLLKKEEYNDVIYHVLKVMIFSEDFIDDLKHTANDRNLSILALKVTIDMMIKYQELSDKNRIYVHVVEERLQSLQTGFKVPEKSPYIDTFNKIFLRFSEHGLLNHWIENHMLFVFYRYFSVDNTDLLVPFSMYHLKTPFYILKVGLCVSIFAIVFEVLLSLHLDRRTEYLAPFLL